MTGRWRRIRAVLALGVGALIVIGVVLLAGKGRKPHPPPSRPSLPTAATDLLVKGTLGAKNGVITFPDHGPRIWVARAKQIAGDASTGMVTLQGVQCSLYRDGQETLRVDAARGTAHARGSAVVMSLTGAIRAEDTRRRLRLTADALDWSSAHDRISATNVAWLGAGFSHRGNRAVLSTDLTRAAFTGKVRTRTQE